jgi:hypothetical protein
LQTTPFKDPGTGLHLHAGNQKENMNCGVSLPKNLAARKRTISGKIGGSGRRAGGKGENYLFSLPQQKAKTKAGRPASKQARLGQP